jgi:multidrug efflux system outer membrane protein
MTDTTLRRGATFAALIVLIIVVVIAAALAGCAVGPDYHQPATPVAARFAAAADAPYSGGAASAEFWTEFGDPELNTLVADALSANHDLRIALAHLHEARALRRQTQFDLAPTITADGGYTKERFAQVDSPTGVAYTTDYYSAGFDAFWELDFFGRVRRSVQAQDAQVGAAEAGLHDAQVSVTAEVARNYFALRGAQLQLSVAQRNVDNQRETLKLTEAQLSAGRSTELDTARAQAQLSTTLATIGPLEATAARAIHRLAVLTGREPNALTPQLQRPADPPRLARRRNCCAGDPTSALPNASWPLPPRWSASPSAISSPRSPSPAASTIPRRSWARWAIPPAAASSSALRSAGPRSIWGACRHRCRAAVRVRTWRSRSTSRRSCARWKRPRTRWSRTRARVTACSRRAPQPRRAASPRASRASATRRASLIFSRCWTPSALSSRPRIAWPSHRPMRRPA